MNDQNVKKLIAKLTGVPLVRPRFVGAMADVMGANFLRNRNLKWVEYQSGDPMQDCPPEMKAEIDNIINDFHQRFAQSMGHQPPSADTRLIFAYYAKDPAVPQDKLAQLQNHPNFQQMMEVVEFINSHGLRLWMSPNGIHEYVRRTGRRGDLNAVNGSTKFFENFGYAWGAKKAAVNRNIRRADFLPSEKAHQFLSDPNQLDELEQSGRRIVRVVTAQKNGAWGVFFTDNTQLFPVIGDNYYASARTNEGDNGLADKAMFAASKGQHRKFYGYKTDDGRGKVFTMPTQTQFTLANGPQDPNPQPVHKGTMGGTGRDQRFYLWVKNDGTLWWLPSHEARGILGGVSQAQPHPLTKEQVDQLNLEKDEYFILTNPDKFVYSWDSVDPVVRPKVEQDYRQKTDMMNRLYDAMLQLNPDEIPHVGLNAFKYCVVGPAFKQGANYDEKQTTGNMPYSTTYVGDQAEMGMKQPGQMVMRREDWVVVGDEFNTARAQSTGTHGFQVAQSIDGLGALSSSASLEDALAKAFRTWGINAPFPNAQQIAEAQQLFNTVHAPEQNAPEQAQPPVTGLETPGQPQQPSPEQPQAEPAQQPAQMHPNPQVTPKQPARNSLNASGNDLIKRLRKLG